MRIVPTAAFRVAVATALFQIFLARSASPQGIIIDADQLSKVAYCIRVFSPLIEFEKAGRADLSERGVSTNGVFTDIRNPESKKSKTPHLHAFQNNQFG